MNRTIRNITTIINGYMKCICLKIFHAKSFRYGHLPRISLRTEITLDRGGRLEIGNRFLMRGEARIRVSKNSNCIIGNNVALAPNAMLACHKKISIGDNVQISPNAQIYDHDHDFRCIGGLKANHFTEAEVHIGNNVWIGANAIILKGSHIGDNCVVAANTVVKGSYSEHTLIVQKRETKCIPIQIKEKG